MSKKLANDNVPFVRSPYNYDPDVVSLETGLKCEDPSRTSQAFVQESDINWIVENFTRSPDALASNTRTPQFGDFTDLPTDYHSALNQVRNADAMFMGLPANVRSRFGNDPGKLLEFLSDDSNREEAISLGFVAAVEQDLSPAPEARVSTSRRSKGAVEKSVSEGDSGDE